MVQFVGVSHSCTKFCSFSEEVILEDKTFFTTPVEKLQCQHHPLNFLRSFSHKMNVHCLSLEVFTLNIKCVSTERAESCEERSTKVRPSVIAETELEAKPFSFQNKMV